nr:MAG TPA: major capsid protein [Caudoviricetes sp.]
MKTLKEIETRFEEIEKELEREDITTAEVENLTDEVATLEEERKEIISKAEKRQETLNKVLEMRTKEDIYEERKENGNMKEERKILAEQEYRTAFLKNLQGKKLTEKEERALTTATASVGAVIPTQTQDLIIEKVFQQAPLLSEIELLRVEGNVTFAVEADATEANVHIEGATINEDGDVLIPVTLTSYEINKYITISKSVSKMSVDAFENWLVNMISKRIARKITKLIISGTGKNQPTGVEKANTWDETNSVTVAKDASLKESDVTAAVALLPGAYDSNAKWLMSKKTLFADYRPLQDKSKNNVFVKDANTYYVEGYPVMLDDEVALHDAYLGDFKMYAGNLAEDITVETGRKLQNNTLEYLGSAMFDGKPALGEAFVKITKAVAELSE